MWMIVDVCEFQRNVSSKMFKTCFVIVLLCYVDLFAPFCAQPIDWRAMACHGVPIYTIIQYYTHTLYYTLLHYHTLYKDAQEHTRTQRNYCPKHA